MAQFLSDRRDMDFVLHEQMLISAVTQHTKFQEFNNRKTIDMIISEARNLALKELMPTNREGDSVGCQYADGNVTVPDCFHKTYKLLQEGEWFALTRKPEFGGQGMPRVIRSAVNEMFYAANAALMMYPGLAQGAGELVETFGTEIQKKLFVKKLYSGEWGGTMMLTEPEAGSDVGSLTTTASRNADGTYNITGNKIFITGAEQDLTENIIHPVLARIEGAPAGTKGISLFLVPKIWVNDDGSLGAPNDVVVSGIEHKMGIKGSATCSVTLGGKGQCRGTLLGEENKGMRAMFHMMNGARLGVGGHGLSMASAAYLFALEYARTRIQGKSLASMHDKAAASVTIINHPDVRRMLMNMKSYVDGMRSFLYYVGICFDRKDLAVDDEQQEYYNGMIEILTPVIKAYFTDRAMDITSWAVQIHGGYGYTEEFPVEQLMRDCKITQIYEGSNGIQAADLVGRKLSTKKGQLFENLLQEIRYAITNARTIPVLKESADRVEEVILQVEKTAAAIGKLTSSENILNAFAFAHPFLEVVGDIVMAWMHLWRATIAAPSLEKLAGSLQPEDRRKKAATNKDAAFYEGILSTTEYFIHTLLPVTEGKMNSIAAANDAAVNIPEASFCSK